MSGAYQYGQACGRDKGMSKSSRGLFVTVLFAGILGPLVGFTLRGWGADFGTVLLAVLLTGAVVGIAFSWVYDEKD